jgi:hypothetical protein
MAWFHFCTANHNQSGRDSLHDMADWFVAGLTDLGHKVSFSDRYMEYGAINLLWECFEEEFCDAISDSNALFGIIATEIPDGVGFNWRHDGQWLGRFDRFLRVANYASFIWTMTEASVPFYSKIAPTSYLEMGFSERLIPSYIDQEPTVDFCFFGAPTEYREAAIAKIRKHAAVEWPNRMLPSEEVGRLIGRSKVGLSFKQSENWPVPSPTRLGRLMMAKRGVACEHVTVPTRQGQIAGICPRDADFVDYVLAFLKSDWRQKAEEVFEQYRSEMPMRDIMGSVIEKTVPVGKASRRQSLSKIRNLTGLPSSIVVPSAIESLTDLALGSNGNRARPKPWFQEWRRRIGSRSQAAAVGASAAGQEAKPMTDQSATDSE